MSRELLVVASPLPAMRNGIADYTGVLLQKLCKKYECLAVVDRPEEISSDMRNITKVISHEDYWRIADSLKGERHLFQLGNNFDHISIVDMLTRVPAVVVLHDITLLYLMEIWCIRRFGDPTKLIDAVYKMGGSRQAALIDFKFNVKAPLGSAHTEVNCLQILNACCQRLITHSQFGKISAQASGFTGPIDVIPHFAELPNKDKKRLRRMTWRKRWGATRDTLVFTSLGFVTPNKRLTAVLEALAQLPETMGDWRYVIAGEDRDPAVRKTCYQLGLQNRVIFMNYLTEDDFDGVLSGADALINLRYPTSGETSGTVCRAMAHALPCVVSDHGWYAELPDAATYKVTPNPKSTNELTNIFKIMILDRQTLQSKARQALAYARQDLALKTVMQKYVKAIEETHDTGASRMPGPGSVRHICRFSKPSPSDTIAIGSGAEALHKLLRNEHAMISGQHTQPVWDDDNPHLKGLFEKTAETAQDRQVFSVITDDGVPGKLLVALRDIATRLRPGELATIAWISRGLHVDHSSHHHSPLEQATLPLDRPLKLMQSSMHEIGLTVLRKGRYLIQMHEDNASDTPQVIYLATARLDSQAVSDIPGLSNATMVTPY